VARGIVGDGEEAGTSEATAGKVVWIQQPLYNGQDGVAKGKRLNVTELRHENAAKMAGKSGTATQQ